MSDRLTGDRPRFAAVPYRFIEDESISCQAKALYLVIARHANYDTSNAFPSYATLGAKAGIKSQTTVSKALGELVKAGYIIKRHSQTVNHYHLVNQWGTGDELSKNSTLHEMDSGSPRDGLCTVHEMDTNDNQLKKDNERGGEATGQKVLSDRMTDLLEPYHDNPLLWLRQNKDGIVRLREHHSDTELLAALSQCLTEGGKLAFFVSDIAKWLAKAKRSEKPPEYKPYKLDDDERFTDAEEVARQAAELVRSLRERVPA